MFKDSVSVLVSPFWESVDEQWVGGTLVLLAVLTLFSQAVGIARTKSWRMFFTAIMFSLLAGVMTVPFADSRSPRELQHWLMSPPVLGTLTVLQILWVGITVFLPVREEFAEQRNGVMSKVLSRLRLMTIRLIAAIPSPVSVMFLLWIEQNILMSTAGAKPQIIGLEVAAAICGILTLLTVAAILLFKKYQLLGLHLLTGCLLMTMCVLLPCLTQKLNWESHTVLPGTFESVLLSAGAGILVLIGVFFPCKKRFPNL
ncbi:MAG: hypothetical protein LBQ54_08435 [Planctomycetaceae bacterium]|jgi:membrane associated rhomboid family serine protease|nr:hypothetical protein [Planctomycetaceae bacterium]